MRTHTGRARKAVVALVGAASALAFTAPSAVAAEGASAMMCQGRSDALVRLNAHANGSTKYVLNVETDASGQPSGVLVVGRGAARLEVDFSCRLWQHRPGDEPVGEDGHADAPEEGASVAHVVGFGSLADGTSVLVRTDVRDTEEGSAFRVRYRPTGVHDEGGPEAEVEWTWVPTEGWAPLDLFLLR